MKKILVLCSLVCLSTLAYGSEPGLLLTKYTQGGNILPKVSTTCEVYPFKLVYVTVTEDQTQITTRTLTKTSILSFSGIVNQLVEEAANGVVSQTPGLPDIGGSQYSGFRQGLPLNQGIVALKQTGLQNLTNSSASATSLVEFLDLNCGE